MLNNCKRKDETNAQLMNNSANANNDKEVVLVPASKEKTMISRVPFRPKYQVKAKPHARKTKEWVKAVFTGAKKVDSGVKNVDSGAKIVDSGEDDSNPFSALADLESTEEVKESRNSVQINGGRNNNILDASSLPPPSLLSGGSLQVVTYKGGMEGYGLAAHAKSAPPSPNKQGENKGLELDQERIQDDNVDELEVGQVIMLKEGDNPSYG
ncbi:hypothetical protein LIER_22021 [Lithospermum erythrorhizon]|uniref:Uncharacterized protein n=1 Tax=Lithospermum erythrorhizon TaxID=34254 RepID=A0AAV3QS99_LITER